MGCFVNIDVVIIQIMENRKKNIGRSLVVYLGSAWVFIEALNFLIDKYYWNSGVLDILILLIIFGLPAMFIYLWFDRKFTKKAIILHSVNIVITLAVISFSIINPNRINPSQIRLINFQNEQKKLAGSVRSLAILPFSNITGTEDNVPLVSGLHDALISEFGQIGGIRVISTTSTLAYANSQKSVKSIASELKVDAIIETSVLSVDNGIRIQVKLINAVPELVLWTQTFDSRLDNIMGLYGQIISNIAKQIHLALSPDEQNVLGNSELVNPEAYKAYLEGNYQSKRLSAEGFQLALENYQRSFDLDSTYAPAYAGMAFAWIAGLQMRQASVTEAIPQIYNNNLKALLLDPNHPEAHYNEALMSFQGEWDWSKSEAAFRKAIALDPSHVLAHAYFGHLLLIEKRFDEAIHELDLALDMDPKNHLVLSLYAVVLWHYGEVDQAVELAKKTLDINPDNGLIYIILESVNFQKGDFAASMEMLKIKHERELEDFDSVIKEYEGNGYESAIIKLIEELQEQTMVQSLNIALYYNRVGKYEEAISWMEKAYTNHDPDMPYAFLPAELNNLKSDPRYAALAQKMKLPL